MLIDLFVDFTIFLLRGAMLKMSTMIVEMPNFSLLALFYCIDCTNFRIVEMILLTLFSVLLTSVDMSCLKMYLSNINISVSAFSFG